MAKGKLAVSLAIEERYLAWNCIAKGKLAVSLAIEERVFSEELHLLTPFASTFSFKIRSLLELFAHEFTEKLQSLYF